MVDNLCRLGGRNNRKQNHAGKIRLHDDMVESCLRLFWEINND
jgi:hypothetical protein